MICDLSFESTIILILSLRKSILTMNDCNEIEENYLNKKELRPLKYRQHNLRVDVKHEHIKCGNFCINYWTGQ